MENNLPITLLTEFGSLVAPGRIPLGRLGWDIAVNNLGERAGEEMMVVDPGGICNVIRKVSNFLAAG
jgi:hypothetical protein